MISRALNSNNDIFVSNGRISVVTEGAQVAQHVRTRLLFYLKEWFLDLSAGTEWFESVFVKPVNLATIESVIKARIANTPELSAIRSFEMSIPDPTNRQLILSFEAETDYGTINIEEVFINA